MKRGIIAAAILTLVTLTAVSVSISLTHKTKALCEIAKAVTESKISYETLNEEWNRQVIYFELFTEHNSFEHIEKRLNMLPHLNGEEYKTECAHILIDLQTFNEHISFKTGNLF